jgi:hypothetical protein
MGFTSMSMSDKTTTGFIFYGQWIMVELDSGDISSSFCTRENRRGMGFARLYSMYLVYGHLHAYGLLFP